MSKIKIYDAIMGSGKTYDAIQRMDKMIKDGEKFIYITPFLDEVKRVIDALPDDEVVTPLSKEDNGGKPVLEIHDDLMRDDEGFKAIKTAVALNKRGQFLKMAAQDKNIVSTHALFCTLKRTDFDLFTDYTLILDEVVNPLKIERIGDQDIKIMKDQELILVDEESFEVKFINDNYHDPAFNYVKSLCESSTVFCMDKHFFIWLFPKEVFKEFKEVQILTFQFEGSLMSAYFRLFEMDYEFLRKDYSDKLIELTSLLNIYKGKANQTKGQFSKFCKTWSVNASKSTAKKVQNQVSNILKRNFGTSSNENAFTTFKACESKFKGAGYSRGFIPINARATNDFAHKKSMAYLGNRYFDVQTKNFFENRGIELDQDLWALSELVQWIWRGCIRNDEKMNLYIPSMRMRGLLEKWLKGAYISKEVKQNDPINKLESAA